MAKTGAIAKLEAMTQDLPSYDAKALKELVASGGDVPSNYKGREHVWAKKVKKFAEGGKVEDKAYIGYRRAGRRPESQQSREASANIPVAVARGLVSGTLGLPGDIESLARMPYELITGKESKTILPTSEDIEKRLPFRGASQTPVGQMFTGAGQLAGGAYTGPLSGARAAMAVPRAVVRAGQDFVMAAPQGAPRMFIGPKAKTWNQANADAAARMEREGRDPVDIWRQTGTFRGADGILRQEISDVGAIYRNPADLKELGKQKKQEALDLKQRLVGIPGQKDMFPKALTEARKPAREQVKRLKEESEELLYRDPSYRGQSAKFVLEHPELYRAYPELANIKVLQGGRGVGNESASLMGGKRDMEVEVTQRGLRGNPRSSMLHEMQHAVQTLEDMAPGGSPSMAFQNPEALKILEDLRARALTPMSFDDYAERYSHLANKEAGYQDYLKSIPDIVKNMDRELQSQAAMEYYKRLAGEAEARATQMREPMSASQRAQEFPYSSYDVLPEDLIVKPAKGNGIQAQIDFDQLKSGGIEVPSAGFSKEDKAKLRPLYNQGLIRVEDIGGKRMIVPGRGAWYEFATPEQRTALDSLQRSDGVRDLTLMDPTESLLNSAQASFFDFEIVPGVRNVPIKNLEPLLPGYDSPNEMRRIQDLSNQIKESKQIEPLFIGVDPTGSQYIMEGQHRIRALKALGYDEVPARIVVDMDDIKKASGGEVKMAEGGAAFGRYTTGKKYQGAVKRAKEADVNKLPDPRTYAAVMGLLGSAPDELGFSVMHPDYKGIQKAGERGFVGGTILGVAPVVAPLTRGLPVGAAIKPVGGNWMTGGVERALEPLKTRTIAGETPAQRIPRHRALLQDPSLPPESKATVQRHLDEEIKRDAIDQWVNRNLTNYVKKQMATPDDPVRGLAERGIVHKNIDQAIPNWQFETTRKKSGYPVEGFGQSQQAKDWENLTDASFVVKKAKELIDPNYMEDIRPMYREMQAKANLENNPWLSKVDPEANIYHASTHDLGFDHIVDVLKQDLDAGRIRPDQLNKVSMEQAVRRTYEYDQEMAKKMREAQIKATEGMPVHKEYPEGYRWIELAPPKELTGGVTLEPKAGGFDIIGPGGEDLGWAKTKQDAIRVSGQHKALEDALKYEGDTMGHCVGGYCPDVLEGRSRIYSLRDAKGEPHVTVEVEPRSLDTKNWFFEQPNEIVDEIRSMVGNSPTPAQMADAIKSHPKYIEDSAKVSPAIVQIKGKQNRAPKEEYLPFVQDFVRSGQWSGVGDLPNTGMFKIESGPRATEFDRAAFERYGNYATTQELDDLERMLKAQQPEGMKAGGAVGCGCNDEPKMQAGGAIKTLKNLLGGGAKAEDAATAAQRAAAGRMAADVAKATQPMKMSEALGNLNVEGKGKVKVTQSDRTRVGGGNIGGAMFPGLSQVDPFYQDLVWGVGKKSTGSGLINQSDDLTYWSTLLGSEDQLKSNPIVFNKLRAGFVDAMKQGKLSKELEDKINKNLSVTFGEGANIRDPKIWQKADTFERRTALADVMLGQGLPPNKGGVPLGGEKSGKGVIFKPTDILKRETEPLLLHPEHGGDVPTFAVGPRLFQFSGGMKVRPDLHPGFPFLLEGQDMGMVFRPAPGEIAMRDFNQRMLTERGRKPGYYEWTMGEKGKGLPSQLITDEYLTYLQKQGYAEGGKVKSGLSALEKV